MKPHLSIIYVLAFVCGTGPSFQHSSVSIEPISIFQKDTVKIAPILLTLADAEKIMGEKAILTGNTSVQKRDTLEYKCDYTAITQDKTTGKTGKLYFMYEIYKTPDAAAHAYDVIYQGNRQHEGVEPVSGLGTEAYYHTDGTGFNFALVRKNNKMIRLKLNKITSHSSPDAFKEVTKRIVDKL